MIAAAALRALVRSGLSSSAKHVLADALCHERFGRLLGTVFRDRIPGGGLRIRTGHPKIAPRTKAEIFWGIYESAEIRFVRAHLRPDLDVVELGASLGVVSCHIARAAGANARLFAVEANPDLIDVIRANLRDAAPEREVQLLHRAIDYGGGDTVRLALGDTTAATRVASHAPPHATASAPASTLGALLQEHRIDGYALICDIEGSEAGIIFEDAPALAGCQQIIAELHDTTWQGRSLSAEDLADALRNRHGFRVLESHGKVWAFAR